ncbi:Shedu anti-phage system protein SduA domain-containing protein [Arthrobacter psychrochitiniphilus]|uniref:Shedu anti-phage system protein SduA domain-containing protein n=1 Tax=Arthrobacter psychrochitiniphilus TaxID=291045 RepID=UPI003F7BB498
MTSFYVLGSAAGLSVSVSVRMYSVGMFIIMNSNANATATATAQSKLVAIHAEWQEVKKTDDEKVAQDFLEKHPALLPGAWGDIGPGGHHGPLYSTIFRQPPLRGLDAKLIPDFMWIARSTVNVSPVCIEIERPTKKWFTGAGQPTADLTQARDQLLRWQAWFADTMNQEIFREVYLKGRFRDRLLTPQFVLVYGRESDFTENHKLTTKERHSKRHHLQQKDEHYFTFDSLDWDKRQEAFLTTSAHDNGQFEVSWINEDFEYLGDATGAHHLGDIDAALAANPSITTARADEIRSVWAKEQEEGARLAAGKTHKELNW